MVSLFITATGTGIGKTTVCAALASALSERGKTIYHKPVQTGARTMQDSDAATVRTMVPSHSLTIIPGALFEPACSPHLAAHMQGTSLDIPSMATAIRSLNGKNHAFIVEGAGGLLVPMGGTLTMRDLIRESGLPALIVASPRLGTLNHTLLTVECMANAGIPLAGIVLCDTDGAPWTEIETNNYEYLERVAHIPLLGILPYLSPSLSIDEQRAILQERGNAFLCAMAQYGVKGGA